MAIPITNEDIDRKIEEYQAERKKILQSEANGSSEKIGFLSTGHFDKDIYSSGGGKYDGYVTSIGTTEGDDDEEDMGNTPAHISYNASSDLIKEAALAGEDQTFDPFEESRRRRIVERHDDYHLRQLRHMMISPVRADPFFEGVSLE